MYCCIRSGVKTSSAVKDLIEAENRADQWQPATIMREAKGGVEQAIRKTMLQWVDLENHWLSQLILPFAKAAAKMLEIEIWGPIQALQLAKYAPGDYYRSHVDTDTGRQNMTDERKLSICVMLTENPTLRISGVTHQPPLGIGSAVAFPSYCQHEVPESDMPRYSLVGWFTGQRWR